MNCEVKCHWTGYWPGVVYVCAKTWTGHEYLSSPHGTIATGVLVPSPQVNDIVIGPDKTVRSSKVMVTWKGAVPAISNEAEGAGETEKSESSCSVPSPSQTAWAVRLWEG